MTNAMVLGNGISFIIVAVNTILSKVIIQLVSWIGLPTQSQRLGTISNGIFMAQFFNTGFLLLLVNANFEQYKRLPNWVREVFTGPFSDYTPDWYDDVGAKITQTMLINSVMPYVNVVSAVLVPKIKMYIDSRGNIYNTKKTSMAQFK